MQGVSRGRLLALGLVAALVITAAGILVFQSVAAGNPFLERMETIAAETFSPVVPFDRLAGYTVDDLCIVPAGADPRAIATAGGMPASALFNIAVADGEVGFLMHGEGQTTFGAIPASAWTDDDALSRCVAGGGFAVAFSAVEPLRGGRLVAPRPSQAPAGVEALPLPPVPR
ncbi:MAG: hypothetical protein AB7O56_13760 [Bauldia sp.]